MWHYKRMFWNPRYGTVGFVGMSYYVAAEVLAPVIQLLAIVAVPLAAAAGVLHWGQFARTLAVLAPGSGVFTCAVFLLEERARRTFSVRDLAHMIALAPFELFFYRLLIMFAQLKGTIDFLLGDRRWYKFDRNDRSPLTPVVKPIDRRAA